MFSLVFPSHNVPAVYDVLTARIEKCAAFLGQAKCWWSEVDRFRGQSKVGRSVATDLGERNPEERSDEAYTDLFRMYFNSFLTLLFLSGHFNFQ
jgi:hypothetical protein